MAGKNSKTKVNLEKALFGWVESNFTHARTEPINGIVLQCKVGGAHRKIVKLPTKEFKGGVFFGAILNPHLAKIKGLDYHKKSNVYKLSPGKANGQVVRKVKDAIYKVVDADQRIQVKTDQPEQA